MAFRLHGSTPLAAVRALFCSQLYCCFFLNETHQKTIIVPILYYMNSSLLIQSFYFLNEYMGIYILFTKSYTLVDRHLKHCNLCYHFLSDVSIYLSIYQHTYFFSAIDFNVIFYIIVS